MIEFSLGSTLAEYPGYVQGLNFYSLNLNQQDALYLASNTNSLNSIFAIATHDKVYEYEV
jgi:hypothetical protein